MRQFFGYIRVSTARQGKHSSSLPEQRSALEEHARRNGLAITEWFIEQESAAKRGRSKFNAMLALLRAGAAQGVVIHKIDRGARNLRDWADLGELIDSGIDVRFANESLDLQTRGGRLSADIQAVVASDYIRNLKEEVRKGFYGRLRQGVLPLPAPVGYRDEGAGKPKTIDPVAGPLVRRVFELYSAGGHTLRMLVAEFQSTGLRTREGKPLNLNMVSRLLNNPFYIGIIRIKRTGEHFEGKHEPLISKSLFDRVQDRLSGRIRYKGIKHVSLYRREFVCGPCQRVLIPERQKGHTYYRCHGEKCTGSCVREEALSSQVRSALASVRLQTPEILLLESHMNHRAATSRERDLRELEAARLELARLDDRDKRLVDACIDGILDKRSYEERKELLLKDRAAQRERIGLLESGAGSRMARVREKLELLKTASLSHGEVTDGEKLQLLKRMSSNLTVHGKYVVVTWDSTFRWLANRVSESYGPLGRNRTYIASSANLRPIH